MKPLYVINFKTYPQGTGKKALRLAEIIDKVAEETGERVIIAVQATDIREIAKRVSIEVFAQHIDGVKPGAHTGHILAEAVAEAGASGTLLNHSERRISFEEIERAVERAREVGLKVIICAKDAKEAEEIAELRPDYVAIEPPELIGGNVSVSKARPELIERGVKAVAPISLLVGAGVKTYEDVRIALGLGARGVLVASGIVKAEDPGKAMLKLMGKE